MKKLLLFLLVLLAVPVVLAFEEGNGTVEAPYQISSCSHLNQVRNDLTAYYVLVSDVDCSETYGWSDSGWDTINNFDGVFEGAGFSVSNVFLNHTSGWGNSGVFNLADNGVVRNVNFLDMDFYKTTLGNLGVIGRNNGLIDNVSVTGYIRGREVAGAVVGWNHFDGVVSNSSSYATVSGENREAPGGIGGLAGLNIGRIIDSYSKAFVYAPDYLGGFVGWNHYNVNNLNEGGEIDNSYSKATVVGGEYVGGFAGRNAGFIRNSYAIANVTGDSNVGGFVGYNVAYDLSTRFGRVINSYSASYVNSSGSSDCFKTATHFNPSFYSNNYCDVEAANKSVASSSVGVTIPMNTTQMTFLHDAYAYHNWDFDNIWGANHTFNNGYPFLQWEGNGTEVVYGCTEPWAVNYDRAANIEDGSCVFPIYDCQDLQSVAFDLEYEWRWNNFTSNFILMNDIDCSESYNWTDEFGDGFYPIHNFTGVFDGNRKTISNLYIYRPDFHFEVIPVHVGFFGLVNQGGVVRDLGLLDANITGWRFVGGIAGGNAGLIERVFITGFVHGTFNDIGGLVGVNGGTLRESYSMADMGSGGGLLGWQTSNSVLDKTYFRGVMLNGGGAIAGLPSPSGTIRDSYMAGYGTTGFSEDSFTNRAVFYDSNISGFGNGYPLTTEDMQYPSSYYSGDHWSHPWYWDFEEVWGLQEGVNDFYPYLRWQEGCMDPTATNYETFASVERNELCEYSSGGGGGGGWPDEPVFEEPVFVIPTPEGRFDLMVFFERLFSGELFRDIINDFENMWHYMLLIVVVLGLIIYAATKKKKSKFRRRRRK